MIEASHVLIVMSDTKDTIVVIEPIGMNAAKEVTEVTEAIDMIVVNEVIGAIDMIVVIEATGMIAEIEMIETSLNHFLIKADVQIICPAVGEIAILMAKGSVTMNKKIELEEVIMSAKSVMIKIEKIVSLSARSATLI